MNRITCFVLALVFGFTVTASFAADAAAQQGKTATVRLISATRAEPRSATDAPDGVMLRFLVVRLESVSGQLAIKETRDAIIEGKSYAQTTRELLKKDFEPETVVDSASKFFSRHPELTAPSGKLNTALVVSVALRGASLKPGQTLQAVLHVGFGEDIGDFPFALAVPVK